MAADELEELVAAAVPVAPVAALDRRAHAHGAAADDLRGLLGALVAVLVGVVAERDGGAAGDDRGPLALERAGAGREHEDGGDVADELEEAGGVGLAFGDEPVERVALADDDRPQPGRRVLGVALVRGAVERPVLDRGDAAGAVVARERELDAAVAAMPHARAERRRAPASVIRFAAQKRSIRSLVWPLTEPTGSSCAHVAEWSTTRRALPSARPTSS